MDDAQQIAVPLPLDCSESAVHGVLSGALHDDGDNARGAHGGDTADSTDASDGGARDHEPSTLQCSGRDNSSLASSSNQPALLDANTLGTTVHQHRNQQPRLAQLVRQLASRTPIRRYLQPNSHQPNYIHRD
ncbi:MAG: hypothetical protein VX223_05995 [Myxococcota bacterium]|nr:hypothetical protein [Myxococcota bacterium]